MHILITGHTGFKGSWLTMLLTHYGHVVSGVALDPEPMSLFRLADLDDLLANDLRGDIRDQQTMVDALDATQPDVLIHMAAQPLVRESYRSPRLTLETNVLGTLNVLEAAGQASSLGAHLVVTTDKVYRNVNRETGYGEDEPLGGVDPYSASKAMADLLTQSWITSFPGPRTAIARGGNVIGGGDFGHERLIPDLVESLRSGRAIQLRHPSAVRPWQHVLDCLSGYLFIVEDMLDETAAHRSENVWNIGPEQDSLRTVGEVAGLVASEWGMPLNCDVDPTSQMPEAELLVLDVSRVNELLGWRNRIGFEEAVRLTCDWYQEVERGQSPRSVTMKQIENFTFEEAGFMSGL